MESIEIKKDKNKLCVGYLRVSSEEQTKGYSIKNQEQTVIRCAGMFNVEIDKLYVDEAKSAFKKNVMRYGFNQMIEDVKDNKINMIFVWKLDRLIRNNIKNEELFILFEQHNVKVISVTENHLDFTTADGRANIRRKGVENQYESERTSERVISSAFTSAKMGNYPKGKIPLGYKRIHNEYGSAPLQLDEKIAPYVKKIFEKMYFERIGSWKMLSWLNSNDYLNMKWREEFLYSLLKNEIYIGTYVNNVQKPTLRIENHTPRLIDDEIFYGIRDLVNNRFRAKKYKYHLKGYVFCYRCGTVMKAKSAKNGKSKKAYLYYYCSSCKCRVNHEILNLSITNRMNSKILESQKGIEDLHLRKLQKKLENVEHLISENEILFVEELIDIEYYETRSRTFLKTRIEIMREIELKKKHKGYILWDKLNYSEKRKFLENTECQILIICSKSVSLEYIVNFLK